MSKLILVTLKLMLVLEEVCSHSALSERSSIVYDIPMINEYIIHTDVLFIYI